MTKDEVKLLCETNERLQWWAMVLFAEISEVFHHDHIRDEAMMNTIARKVDEFPKLVIMNVLEAAKNKSTVNNDDGMS